VYIVHQQSVNSRSKWNSKHQ